MLLFEAELAKIDEANQRAKEAAQKQKQAEIDKAAAAAAQMTAATKAEDPAQKSEPEAKAEEGKPKTVSSEDFVDILKFLGITPDKVRQAEPGVSEESLAQLFAKPNMTLEAEQEIAALWAEAKDLQVHTKVNYADTQLSVLQRYNTGAARNRTTEIKKRLKNLIYPFTKADEESDILKMRTEQSVQIQRKILDVALQNLRVKREVVCIVTWKFKSLAHFGFV